MDNCDAGQATALSARSQLIFAWFIQTKPKIPATKTEAATAYMIALFENVICLYAAVHGCLAMSSVSLYHNTSVCTVNH